MTSLETEQIMLLETQYIEETPILKKQDYHKLESTWIMWAHMPHDVDWTIHSYKKIYTIKNVEEAIAITETLPEILVSNCMLFLMKEGINPTWEDPKNKNGGCFSYKVANKLVHQVWKQLSYVIMGETISNQTSFVANVNGITISPKKSFCIIKIWMASCDNQNPAVVSNDVKGLSSQGCLFKKHSE